MTIYHPLKKIRLMGILHRSHPTLHAVVQEGLIYKQCDEDWYTPGQPPKSKAHMNWTFEINQNL